MKCKVEGCERDKKHVGMCGMHYQRLKNHGTTDNPRSSLAVRFWSKVDKSAGPDDCWLWCGGRLVGGYGSFMISKRPHVKTTAHRAAMIITAGPINAGLYVCHRCDNRACVNPAHLFLGTPTDNMRDAALKGRTRRGSAHPFSKLTEKQVDEMKRLRSGGSLLRVLSKRFGVAESAVSRICNGVRRAS